MGDKDSESSDSCVRWSRWDPQVESHSSTCVVRSSGEVPTLEASPSAHLLLLLLLLLLRLLPPLLRLLLPLSSSSRFFLVFSPLPFIVGPLASSFSRISVAREEASSNELLALSHQVLGAHSSEELRFPSFLFHPLASLHLGPLWSRVGSLKRAPPHHYTSARRSARIYFRRVRHVLLQLVPRDMQPSLTLALPRLITDSPNTRPRRTR